MVYEVKRVKRRAYAKLKRRKVREGKYRRKETKTDTVIKGLIRFLQFGFLLGDLGVGE